MTDPDLEESEPDEATTPDMPVEVVAHDPSWRLRFEDEARLLEPLLEPWIDGGIHHVGSTAVRGLAAKPIVDIMAGVANLEAAMDAVLALGDIGYLHWDQDPEPWRLWLLKPHPARRTHHLQLVEPDHPEFRAKLAFRDALRADRDLAGRYERLKRRLVVEHRHDRDAYTDAKSDFVLETLRGLDATCG